MTKQPEDLFARLDDVIESKTTDLVSLRRELHANPELSHEEFETTRLLKERLEDLGFEVHVREEGTGLYADLTSEGFDPKTDPTVAIRSDIDALPIRELNDIPYCSQREGVMHACGHDVHMTTVTGAGMAIRDIKDQLDGRLRLLFQHAEEVSPGGAVDMVSFGAIQGVDAVLGLHCDPELEVGNIGLKKGHLTAAFDRFNIKVMGKSGHGARPHHCVDPIFVATQIANAIYQAPARYFDSRDPVVMTIGSFHSGDTPNVIPEVAEFEGTVRTLTQENRQQVEPLLQKLAGGICMSHGANYELEIENGAPSVINDGHMVDVIGDVTAELYGETAVHQIPKPSMGGEDFAYYLRHVPGAMFRLGTAGPGPRARHFLHSAKFNIDERAIAIGTRVLARSAMVLMQQLASGDWTPSSELGQPHV
jgi:amidohydrolase